MKLQILKRDSLFCSAANKALEGNYLYSCAMQADDGLGTVIVIFNYENPSKVTMEVMVHEFHHAANYVCSFRGIDDEEAETYIQEYLFHTMLGEIDKYNSQKKRKRIPKKDAKMKKESQ